MTLPPVDDLPAAGSDVDLSGRRVLVTGAGNGLGRAIARGAAARGATVVLLDRSVAAAEAVYDEIVAADAPEPAIYPMDLSGAVPDDYAELAERLQASLGGLEALVLNAAELGQPAPLAQYDANTWLRTLHVNTTAPFLLLTRCAPLLQAANQGRVVFISDAAGRGGEPFSGAYGVSKWALEGLMHTYAAELPADTPVRLVSVDPGPLHTALRRAAYSGEDPTELPLPDTVAPAIAALLDATSAPKQCARFRACDGQLAKT